MAESVVFDWVSQELEAATSFNRLTARGTVRLVLKQMGLEARSLNPDQAEVLLGRPPFTKALVQRGVSIDEARTLAKQLAAGLKAVEWKTPDRRVESPEDIFKRFVPE